VRLRRRRRGRPDRLVGPPGNSRRGRRAASGSRSWAMGCDRLLSAWPMPTGAMRGPLRDATCGRRGYCPLISYPTQLAWARPKLLLYGDWAKGIFAVPLAGKPRRIGTFSDPYDAFSVDAVGDRIAHGSSSCCVTSRGPVTVLDVPSGRVVGKIGETATANFSPSLSPDGTHVAFEGGNPTGIRTASVTGGDMLSLRQCNSDPVWSPTGKWIACLAPLRPGPVGRHCCSCRRAASQASRSLDRRWASGRSSAGRRTACASLSRLKTPPAEAVSTSSTSPRTRCEPCGPPPVTTWPGRPTRNGYS
jgi:hypothetical protein